MYPAIDAGGLIGVTPARYVVGMRSVVEMGS